MRRGGNASTVPSPVYAQTAAVMHKGKATPKRNLEKIRNESKKETESKKKVSASKPRK